MNAFTFEETNLLCIYNGSGGGINTTDNPPGTDGGAG